MRIVFMGTPDFAVPSLKKLVANGFDVTLVVTQEDKLVGRKQILTPPAVKQVAEELGIPVFQPKTLKNQEAQERIRLEKPDCIIVAAYGKILPKEVLSIPPYGCINVHGSLLPKYRGAAPIQWAVINGEKETGITIMQMDAGLDTGDILSVYKRPILENETSGEVFDSLAEEGAALLVDTLPKIISGEIKPVKQVGESNYASMLSKEDSWIDFNRSSTQIHNQIRGLNPWPVAMTLWNGKRIKIFKSIVGSTTCEKPGTIISGKPLCIACGNNTSIEIIEMQPEGGKRMTAEDFWRGHSLSLGTQIGK